MKGQTVVALCTTLLVFPFGQPSALAVRNCRLYPEEIADRNAAARQPRIEVPVSEVNGISYVSGGVAEQKPVVERMSSRFNLKLTLATPCGRANVAPLRIEDAEGNTVVEDPAAGPVFLAQMSPGRYTVRVTPKDGEPLVRTVSVPSRGRTHLALELPDHSE